MKIPQLVLGVMTFCLCAVLLMAECFLPVVGHGFVVLVTIVSLFSSAELIFIGIGKDKKEVIYGEHEDVVIAERDKLMGQLEKQWKFIKSEAFDGISREDDKDLILSKAWDLRDRLINLNIQIAKFK